MLEFSNRYYRYEIIYKTKISIMKKFNIYEAINYCYKYENSVDNSIDRFLRDKCNICTNNSKVQLENMFYILKYVSELF